jgi:hydroxymethylbilane synthase
VPIGAAAAVAGDTLTLRGAVLSPDGGRRVAGETAGPAAAAERLGQALAEDLLGQGARSLLAG